MKKALFSAAALAFLSGPAFAQCGGGGHNSGGPLGSYARCGYGYGGWYGGYYAPAPVYAYGGPVYYGGTYPAYGYGYYPGYGGGGGALAAGIIGGLALGALASRSYGYYPRRGYYRRVYRRW